MIYTKMTKAALKLCFEAHKAQQDKSGIPYILKRNIAFLLCLLMILSCFVGCSASKNKSSNANLAFTSVQKQYSVSFLDHDSSEIISMNQEDAKQFEEFVSSVSLEYPYSELYGVNECYDRIFTYSSVSKHERSALDNNGKLTAEHLFELVKENNQQFNEDKKNDMGFYKDAEDDFLLSLCKLIVDTVAEIHNRYPDIDYDRLYCNLANLKVFYKAGLLDFAAVTPDMILQLGDAALQFATIMAGGTGVRNVVVHEIMHIIQLGCSCENIEHCTRRAGITYRWDDVELQGNDWAWFFEGSAEKNMSLLTGEEAMTYQQMINYLQSVNLSTFLNSDIPAYYAETISFYNDPDKLLHIFHASSKEEITEVASLMEAIQIIQYLPDEFQTAYKDKYGIDLSASEEQDKLRYSLKPAVCLTFSKTFYKNLAIALTEGNDITENDLFYLIRIFEAAMDYHSTYTKQERLEINKPFLDRYKEIRTAFFLLLKENGMEIDENAYLTYEMFTEEDPTVANASFRWLVQGKREFLLERTEFLKDQLDSKIA